MSAPDPAVWSCKVGFAPRVGLPDGADYPMRRAVAGAFESLLGFEPEFVFSGWGAELDETEVAVVNEQRMQRAVEERRGRANLGLATTAELLAELSARAEVNGYAGYRTVDA